MKTKFFAITLFALTAATVVFVPLKQSTGAITPLPMDPVVVPDVPTTHQQFNQRPKVEVVFVLDTTGSMGGLIEAAKEKIWSIASNMASAQPAPEIKIGLVAYRDRGDEYVTRVVDLSTDLDSLYAALIGFSAQGGGDGPESVNQALHDAVNRISWSPDQDTYKVVFLVGDAPPHMDYQDEVQYPQTLKVAQHKGIVVNTIQCGQNRGTETEWQRIAQAAGGDFFQVEQGGSAVAISTPYDGKLAELSAKLDDTRLFYGDAEQKKIQQRKLEATKKLHEEASVSSRARRATFNASASGADNLLGENELVDDVASGRVDLDTIETAKLPASLQVMAPAERQTVIETTAARRDELKKQIDELTEQRSSFLKEKVEESDAAKDSLDVKIYGTVREQARAKGLSYEAELSDY